MRLTINGEQASYSLENERTLGEVARGVQAWLGASGLRLTGLEADGRDLLALPSQDWAAIALDGVTELRVAAAHTGPLRIEHWQTVQAWLSMVRNEIAAAAPAPPGNADALEDLLAGTPEILESLAANPFLPTGSDLGTRLEGLLRGASVASVRSWSATQRDEAAGLLGELSARVTARLEDALHPEHAVARSARALRDLQKSLPEVSVMLQTGRDRQAVDIVVAFTEAAQAVIDALPFLPPDAERARLISDLTPVLRQLTEAFAVRDGILIGDLMEYEIAPRMERIIPLLEKTS
jgi:hypothetical protein